MPRVSAGLLMYRRRNQLLEVLLVHPGGPFFKNKDKGAWSIPKGEVEPEEELLACAIREFREELGLTVDGPFRALTPIKQKGGKAVHAWSFAGDCDPSEVVSNTFLLEWPPRSGLRVGFPEIDRAEFFGITTAKHKINVGQVPLLDELDKLLGQS